MMNNSQPQQQKPLPKPSSDIDLQALTTFPHISSDYMSDRIRNKFRVIGYLETEQVQEFFDEDGVKHQKIVKRYVTEDDGVTPVQVVKNDLWATMELFTQDFRLGNLAKEEASYVRFNIDLCTDILIALPQSFHKPALISLERAINVTETSQSKGGFLRRMFNTFFSNSTAKEETPQKRSFFGLGKKNKE